MSQHARFYAIHMPKRLNKWMVGSRGLLLRGRSVVAAVEFAQPRVAPFWQKNCTMNFHSHRRRSPVKGQRDGGVPNGYRLGAA